MRYSSCIFHSCIFHDPIFSAPRCAENDVANRPRGIKHCGPDAVDKWDSNRFVFRISDGFPPLQFPRFPFLPLPLILSFPLPLEVGCLKSSYGVWDSDVSSPGIELGACVSQNDINTWKRQFWRFHWVVNVLKKSFFRVFNYEFIIPILPIRSQLKQ